MSDVQNPWEDGNNSETSASSMGNDGAAKVIHMRKPKIAQNVVNGGGFNFGWIIAVLILVWLATGIYQVQPNEQGVVLRFGKYTETTDAGLHYHIPYPIEEVYKVSMTQERSINLGEAAAYNASNVKGMGANNNSLNSFTESHMLTGDENIVDINLTVVWTVKNAKDYLFSVRNPDETVRVAAQSVLREVVGQSEMQAIITGDRGKVEDDTKA